ncbi:hypothetical protein, partial [Paracoccus halophilus]|uniref:hypothetical protein n=1 Tax=Paracoccus halophilus TaxID=376733 RepID=UPI0039E1CE32
SYSVTRDGLIWVPHGHRIYLRASVTVSILRSVAIGFELCRPGRIGGFFGLRTAGTGRFFAVPGGGKSRGRKRPAFGEKESIDGYAQTGLMVKSSPTSAFGMTQTRLLFQLAIISLDPPPHLRRGDEIL